MKKHTIIGMAGHIDHGKTALIRALTGIETDRLKEEKDRGITIDIGFAYWRDNVTIIDVPGHEKFVRNMVAGVSTVDLFLLVIAADDGVMPQTIEHMDILRFFGVRNGLVALNKVDLADADWLELVEDDVRQFLNRYHLPDVPIIRTSTVSGLGIQQLDQALTLKIDQLEQKQSNRPFRLNIDRSFSARGFGSVVTGTVLSSQLGVGDTVQVLPGRKLCKVRGLQVHQQAVEQAISGQRAAVNLAGISKEELPRGHVLVKPAALEPCHELLAELRTTTNIPFRVKRHSRVHVHLGTAELIGKLDWYDEGAQLQPEETYHARIKLDQPGIAAPGDAILIRSLSPVTTIAGGRVLQVGPARIKRSDNRWMPHFETLKRGQLEELIRLTLDQAGNRALSIQQLCRILFQPEQQVGRVVARLIKKGELIEIEHKNENYIILQKRVDQAVDRIGAELDRVLSSETHRLGLNRSELENILKALRMDNLFLEKSLQKAVNRKVVHFNGELYTSADRAAHSALREEILRVYGESRFNPPDLETLTSSLSAGVKTVKNLTLELSKGGELLSINGQFYLHGQVFAEFIQFLKHHFTEHPELDISVVKDFTRSTRKYIIPLMEYLDLKGLTVRRDNVRLKGPELDSRAETG